MMKIGNVQVRLDAFYIGRTYAGLLEGIPSRADNAVRIDHLKVEAQDMMCWGNHRCAVVNPSSGKPLTGDDLIARDNDDLEWLPKHYAFACLDGPATDPKWCGASALLLFFVEEDILGYPIGDMIEHYCKYLDWRHISANYDV